MPVLNPRWRITKDAALAKPWVVETFPPYAGRSPGRRYFSTFDKACRYVEMSKARYRGRP